MDGQTGKINTFLKNAMENRNQPSPDESNTSGSDHNTPPKLLGSKDKQVVVDLMTLLKPTNLAVTLNLMTPEQKRLQPLVTTPKKDAEADSGETNYGKQGSPNSDLPGNKENGSENEGEASGSPPLGGGGVGGEGNTGGNGNGGRDADHPDKGNPAAGEGS
jgi:hypothetical protein